MDIYSAEIQVNKLLNYVKSLSDAKPRMYQKSKDRLKELANTCNQVIVVISEILQEEALTEDQNEFEGSEVKDFNTVLNSMEDQIAELRQFLSSPKSASSSTSSSRKQVISKYSKCLNLLAKSNVSVVEAEDCGKLLWSWFRARFVEGSVNFQYNMKRIPGWLRDIVVLFGYHLESGSLDQFKGNFYSWIASISTKGNTYSVPYEVYMFDKDPDPDMLTLTSVVIWDILLDYGLKELCDDPSSEFYPSEDCVYSLVGSLRGSVMDPYQNYQYDPTILDRCNLTRKGGDIR